jgi:flagellar basal body-associated protein FliL
MADTSTSGDMSREESEAAIRAMRAGKDPNSVDKPKKKGKKKLILLILILLIGTAGGAGYKFVLAKDEPVHAEVPEPKPEPDEPLDLVYIDLDPLFVPFQTEDGHRHKIVVVLSLEVGREHQSDKKVRSLTPRLREAYVRSLTSRPYPGTGEGSIKIVYLKNRIRAENNRILGTGTVNDVLVRDVRVLPG